VSSTSLLASPSSVTSPRVDVHPPYQVSLGPVAVDLARRGGLFLDPWQADALDVMCAVRPGGRWACFEYGEIVSRQNGKGAILEARALAGLFLFGEDLILWSAHEYKTAMEAFRRVLAILRRLGARLSDNLYDVDGVLVKVINTNGEESLERLDTGQRIKFIARSKGSGRGFSGDVNIIDEAFAYTREQQEALMPTMSARPNPQIIYTSSPPLSGDTGDVMYALRKRADAGGDESLGWRDWGLPGDLDGLAAVNLDDETLWRIPNPSLDGGRLTVEFVRRERRSMSDEGFARERLGIWPRWTGGDDPQWQVIREADWLDAKNPQSQIVGRPAYGVYVPPDRSYAAIGIAGTAEAGGRHIEVAGDGKVLDYRPGTGWVIPRLKALEKHDPSVVVIDDKALAEEAEEAGLTVHRANAGDMVTGCQMLYDGISGADIEARDVHHIGQAELTDAARGAVKRDVGGSWAWQRRDLAVDVTPLAGVSLALFGHATPRVHRPDSQPFFAAWQ